MKGNTNANLQTDITTTNLSGKASSSDVNAKVSKAGDTMTGNLTINSGYPYTIVKHNGVVHGSNPSSWTPTGGMRVQDSNGRALDIFETSVDTGGNREMKWSFQNNSSGGENWSTIFNAFSNWDGSAKSINAYAQMFQNGQAVISNGGNGGDNHWGYTKMTNGLKLCWGVAYYNNSTNATIDYSVAGFSRVPSIASTVFDCDSRNMWGCVARVWGWPSTTNAVIKMQDNGGTPGGTMYVYWIAAGV